MTSKRDLGPVLAIAGGAVVLAAVIWGFIAVGGPGDARARRIDDMTIAKLQAIGTLAQCRVNTGAPPPVNLAEILTLQGQNFAPDTFNRCFYVPPGSLDRIDDIEYSVPDESHINLCASFLRPSDKNNRPASYAYGGNGSKELQEDHPAGRHCYNIRMIKPIDPIPMPDAQPADPPFR